MIDRCFNPDCRRKLHYLRDGRVVRVITGKGEQEVLEHFWLCGPCYEEYNFAFPPSGEVVLAAQTKSQAIGGVPFRRSGHRRRDVSWLPSFTARQSLQDWRALLQNQPHAREIQSHGIWFEKIVPYHSVHVKTPGVP